MSPCPPLSTIEAFATGGLDGGDPRARQVVDHAAGCARCGNLLREAHANERFLREHGPQLRAERTAAERAGSPIAQPGPSLPDSPPGYELVREMARGGQGVVYEAVQRDTKRRVAVKMLRPMLVADHREQLRLEREAEIAAMLRHPGIVAIHESLRTSDGGRMLVMELVEGPRLDQWLERQGRPSNMSRQALRPRLEMFRRLCEAVEHAHRLGVIHRDLKPANILIEQREPEGSEPIPQPRIVDFGIARPFEREADDPLHTRTGQFAGTLAYASPEQVGANNGSIDTRSDVYALGLILHELVLGYRPYSTEGSLQSAIATILSAEPSRPARGGASPRPDRDLWTIISRALSKDRDRRYPSAGSLGRDIARYVAGEPIDARRDSPWYVAGKTAWKHRVALSLAAIPVLAIPVAAVALVRIQAADRIAGTERKLREFETQRSSTVAEIATRLAARPGEDLTAPGLHLSMQNFLAVKADVDAGNIRVSDARIGMLIAEIMASMDTASAEVLVRQSMLMLERDEGPAHPELGRMRLELARVLELRLRLDEAEAQAARAVDETRRAFGPSDPHLVRAMSRLASIQLRRAANDPRAIERAGQTVDKALAIEPMGDSADALSASAGVRLVRARLLSQTDAARAQAEFLLALQGLLASSHDADEALLAALEVGAELVRAGHVQPQSIVSAEAFERCMPGVSPGDALATIAHLLKGGMDGSSQDALVPCARRLMIALREQQLGPDHSSLGPSRAALGIMLLVRVWSAVLPPDAEIRESIALLERALPAQRRAFGETSMQVGACYANLGTAHVWLSEFSKAADWYAKDAELWTSLVPAHGDEYQAMIRTRWTAWTMARAWRFEEAVAWADRALPAIERAFGKGHGATAMMHACKAMALAALGRSDEARQAERDALEVLKSKRVPDDQRSVCAQFLGLCQLWTGRIDEAHATLHSDEGWAFAISTARDDNVSATIEWVRCFVLLAQAKGDQQEADRQLARLGEIARGELTPQLLRQQAPQRP